MARSSESEHAAPTVVNIISVSYSGSTWVNLILGSARSAFSVGELTSIRRHGRPICKLHGEACDVWSRYDDASDSNLVDQIQRVSSGAKYLICNNPRDSQAELDRSGHPQKFIHLVRDGRAVAASQLRKFPDHTMRQAARHWARSVKKNAARLRHRPASDVIDVCYEKLQSNPDAELARLCEFLGLPVDPAMLAYWERDHCFIGGSRGTLYGLAKKREAAVPDPKLRKNAAAQFDSAFYDKADPENFVDERWRRELSPAQLRSFNLWAGRTNRRLGYDR